MEERMHLKAAKFKKSLQSGRSGDANLNNLCEALLGVTDANAFIFNKAGTLHGSCSKNTTPKYLSVLDEFNKTNIWDFKRAPQKHNSSVKEVCSNQEFQHQDKYNININSIWYSFVPIIKNGELLGTLLLERPIKEFDDADLIFAEFTATLAGAEIQHNTHQIKEVKKRNRKVAEQVMNNLSYSESVAITRIFDALNSSEGKLVVGHLAQNARITRTILVNAIQKLEGAGIIESKSLGMKGTYIRVLNSRMLNVICNSR